MNGNLINIGSDLAKVDAHIISQEEYDELPELTDEMFERASYKRAGIEIMPVKIELPKETIQYFKSFGENWQLQMSNVLQEWVKTHPV